MMKPGLLLIFIISLTVPAFAQGENGTQDKDLVKDIDLLQGSWEMVIGNIRSVKTIAGNRETIRRYDLTTGKMVHEHSMEFELSKSGSVRVLTFYPVGGTPQQGASFIYKVDEKNFYDIPGLLQGEDYRNYQKTPAFWHWKRIKNDDPMTKLSPIGDARN